MRLLRWLVGAGLLVAFDLGMGGGLAAATPEAPRPWIGDRWRAERRIIDLHQHIEGSEARVLRAVGILDRSGVGLAVNLSGGTVTGGGTNLSEFQRNRDLFNRVAPGRFLQYFNLDYTGWDDPDFERKAIRQVETAHRLGAAGFKEYKRLGLYLRNARGELIHIDDPKLDGVWRRCGELGMPVSIHVADPKAFWLPFNQQNERWTELKDHRSWWFGDPKQFPSRESLLAALDRVITRHPKTTFVCVHFANNAEDLTWVDQQLDRHTNMMADLAARIPEIGRQDPERVRALFLKHQDRILFATDFQVYDKMILGSSGDAENPSDDDAVEFFHKEWRWLETRDRDWPHMTPIQGDWKIHSIGLPPEVLRKIYFDNARRLLVRSLPTAILRIPHIRRDFKPDGKLDEPEWKTAPVMALEQETVTGVVRTELSTSCRALWSDGFLYLSYQSPFTTLTDYGKPGKVERIKSPQALWNKDVVELFVAPDIERLTEYTEYEWAPNNEALDLRIRRPNSDFNWSSGMEWKVRVDPKRHEWICEVRIPLGSLSPVPPAPGTRWKGNLYRIDQAHNAYLAMNPTLTGTFHAADRFGWFEFLP
jgi:predicted TIM-barrel fold metal-dependent hydrolase